jgi:hypothetical protein
VGEPSNGAAKPGEFLEARFSILFLPRPLILPGIMRAAA